MRSSTPKAGDLEIDRYRFEVRMSGRVVDLTPTELPAPGVETVRGVGYRFRDSGRS
jgi:DNA-binding response OmpR family regulator